MVVDGCFRYRGKGCVSEWMTREVPEANDPDLSVPNVKRRMMQQDASAPFHRLRNPNESKNSRCEILTQRIQSPTRARSEKRKSSYTLSGTALYCAVQRCRLRTPWSKCSMLGPRRCGWRSERRVRGVSFPLRQFSVPRRVSQSSITASGEKRCSATHIQRAQMG